MYIAIYIRIRSRDYITIPNLISILIKTCYNIHVAKNISNYYSKGAIIMSKEFSVLILCLFLITSMSLANPATDGLVGYWSFDEGAGEVVADVTGNGHDGEFAGKPKWVDGVFNSALEFDGVDDHVVVSDDNALDLTDEITMMAWFSPNEALTSRRLMVKNDSIFIIFDFGNSKDSIDFLVKPDNKFAESTTTDWEIGKWYHFAGTFDGKTLRVYVDGKLEGEGANNIPITPSDLDLWIGGDDFGRPTDHFPGKIDEVRIYDKVLSEEDIQKVMDTPADVEAQGKLTTTWANIKGK